MKLYFLRHQAAGVLHEWPFTEPPSEVQLAPILARLMVLYGLSHPKTKASYWTRIVEAEALGPNDIPNAPIPGAPSGEPGTGRGAVTGLVGGGTGSVRNPKG